MKKLIIILIIFASFVSCQKYQTIKIANYSGVEITVNTSEEERKLKVNEKASFHTKDEIKDFKFTTTEDVYLRLFDQGTSPKQYNIYSYVYKKELYIFGQSDTVECYINGQRFRKPMPFSYNISNGEYTITANFRLCGYNYVSIKEEGLTVLQNESYNCSTIELTY